MAMAWAVRPSCRLEDALRDDSRRAELDRAVDFALALSLRVSERERVVHQDHAPLRVSLLAGRRVADAPPHDRCAR